MKNNKEPDFESRKEKPKYLWKKFIFVSEGFTPKNPFPFFWGGVGGYLVDLQFYTEKLKENFIQQKLKENFT